MNKHELLKLHPRVIAVQSYFGGWNIWADDSNYVWLGKGKSEAEAWDYACEGSVF